MEFQANYLLYDLVEVYDRTQYSLDLAVARPDSHEVD